MSCHKLLDLSSYIVCWTLHRFEASGSNLHSIRNQSGHAPRVADTVVKLSKCANVANHDRFWQCSLHGDHLALRESNSVFLS
jgi:hypothetical protein